MQARLASSTQSRIDLPNVGSCNARLCRMGLFPVSSYHVGLYCLVLFIALLLPNVSRAHELSPAVADVELTPASIEMSLRLNLEAVVSEIGPEHEDTDDSPKAEQYDKFRSLDTAALEAVFNDYQEQFLERVNVSDQNGSALSLAVSSIDIPDVGDVSVARSSIVSMIAALPASADALTFTWDEVYGPLILRIGEDSDSASHNQYLLAGQVSSAVPLNSLGKTNWLATAANYLKIGFIHIVPKGLDHILFVIGLFLFSTRWKALLLQVTAFTLAHSITLALGVAGVLQISASIVEPLIALSITAVCLDNMFANKLRRWRVALIVLFGLLHGLGFAGVLGEIGFSLEMLVVSLVSFNIGVELGQLLVIGLCALLVGWPFGSKHWYRKLIVIPSSTMLAIVGLIWFFQRITN